MGAIAKLWEWSTSQFKELPVPTTDCTGRTVVVTGANVGLGLETARHFVRLNAEKVIIACRSAEKGMAAKADLEATTGRRDVVDVWLLDLTSYDSVRDFARRADQELGRLDYLIDNASVAIGDWQEAEGHEITITVNVLSTFLLTLLLLPKLRETSRKFNVLPHIVVVSSDAATWTTFEESKADRIFPAFDANKNLNQRYAVSKLVQLIGVRQLAANLDASPKGRAIVTTLSPGLCATSLFRYAPYYVQAILAVAVRLAGRSGEVGARCIMAAAFAAEADQGAYMLDCVAVPPPTILQGEKGDQIAKKTWTQLLEELEKIEPGVTKNI